MDRRRAVLSGLMSLVLAMTPLLQTAPAEAAPAFRALIFSKTAGFRHDSIPAGLTMFSQLAAANNFEIVTSEDSRVFTPANLATFDVLVMFQTSGMVLDNDGPAPGRAGIHRAAARASSPSTTPPTWASTPSIPWWDQTINGGAHMPEHSPGVLPGHREGRRQGAPVDGGPAGQLGPQRGVVQLRPQPPRRRPRPGDRRRAHLQPGQHGDGAGPPDLLVPRRRRRPGLGHRHGPRHRLLQRDQLPQPRPRRRQVGGRQRARRLRRHRLGQLREGQPRPEHRRPDGPRHRAGRAGLLRPARRRSSRSTSPAPAPPSPPAQLERLHRRRGRPDRHGPGPELRHQQLGLPLLLAGAAARPTSTGSPASRSTATRSNLSSEVVVLERPGLP